MSDERKKQNWRVAPSRSAVPTPNPGMDYWWNRWIDSEEPVPVSQMRQPQAMTAVCYALDFAQWFAERCAEFGRDYTASAAPPSEREAWRYLPSGEWFFMESEDCVHRFSVMERTSSGCVSICSTSWSHERARRDMQSIAELHNRQARAAVPQAAAGQLVAELKAARTAWHEDFGVPVSAEYARFLRAIGNLIDWMEGKCRTSLIEESPKAPNTKKGSWRD